MARKEGTSTPLTQKNLTSDMAILFFFLPLDTISHNLIILGMKVNFKFQFKILDYVAFLANTRV